MELTVWKLEQSWKMIYEPMPVAEAEKLLAEIFPDERPVAGAHRDAWRKIAPFASGLGKISRNGGSQSYRTIA